MHSTPLEWISVTDALPKIDRPHPPDPYAKSDQRWSPLVLVANAKGDTALATYWADNIWLAAIEEWAHLPGARIPSQLEADEASWVDATPVVAWAYLPARVSLAPDSVPERLRRQL
jgi:hypothetical protein